MPFRFRVEGVVREQETGTPLAGLRVRAFDHHLVHDDPLGEACTDAAGRFELHFTEVRFTMPFETRPDLYLQVLDPHGERVLYSTRQELRRDAHSEERYEIAISRETLGAEGAAQRAS